MTDKAPHFRAPRTWLMIGVLAPGAIAWVVVALASSTYLEYSGYLGVVGVALTVGSLEASYLVSRVWDLGNRREAIAAAAVAAAGSSLVFVAMLGGVTHTGFVQVASGVGLVGFSSVVGVWSLFRAQGKSSPATLLGLAIALLLAYFASFLWGAVPAQ